MKTELSGQDDQLRDEFQVEFDETYITSTEIGERLDVERSVILHARRRGMLPNAIVVKGMRYLLWNRDNLTPYLDAWEMTLKSRRRSL